MIKSFNTKAKNNKNEEIIKELLQSNKLKRKQSIDYTYFLELYGPYKDMMSEKEFADILGISKHMYYSIKDKRNKGDSFKG